MTPSPEYAENECHYCGDFVVNGTCPGCGWGADGTPPSPTPQPSPDSREALKWATDDDPVGALAIRLAARATALEEEHGEWTWREIAELATAEQQRVPGVGEVRAKALEEATRVADAFAENRDDENDPWDNGYEVAAKSIAATIRALITTPVAPDDGSTGITPEEIG